MTQIYLVRHAEAEGNLYRRAQGWYNALITENGYAQIEALRARFASVPVDAVYSSDLFRTMTTAKAVYLPKHLPLQTDERLREINLGAWEDCTWSQVGRFDGAGLERFGSCSSQFRPEGGESYKDVMVRMKAAVLDIAARHPGQTVAVFSHGVAIRCLQAAVRDWPPEGMARLSHSDNTAVTLLEVDGERIKAVYENDNSHLPQKVSTLSKQQWWRDLNDPEASYRRDVTLWFRPLNMEEETERSLYRDSRREAWRTIHGEMAHYDENAYVEAAEHQKVFCAMDGDRPAGVLQLDTAFRAEEKVGMIAFYYMTPEYRHKGLGVQLLGQAVSVYRPLGRDRLLLRCAPENAVAQHFYKKYGFRKVGDVPGTAVPLEYLEKYIGYEEQ